jgi:hypothetical protein
MRAPHPNVGANGPQERARPDQPPLNGADRISADPVTNARLFALIGDSPEATAR